MEYNKCMDDSKFGFPLSKSKDEDAIERQHFIIGTENRKPTHEDVSSIQNKTCDTMQEEFDQVLTYFKQILGLPTTKVLTLKISAIEDPSEKNKIQWEYEAEWKIATAEASLYNIKKVKYLAWGTRLNSKRASKVQF